MCKTDYGGGGGGGGGGKTCPKSDYVICERPLMTNAMYVNHIVNVKSPTSERCFSGLRNLLAFVHNLIVQSA